MPITNNKQLQQGQIIISPIPKSIYYIHAHSYWLEKFSKTIRKYLLFTYLECLPWGHLT